MTTVPMPERIARLPQDRRGYPIPYIVQRDRADLPLFIVNNSEVARRCIQRKLCAICGERLTKELWFAGGPGSAFHPHGCYFDTAMHHECVTYAMQVCPYLAMPSYRPADLEKVIPHLAERAGLSLVDNTQCPVRPEIFVVVMAYGQSLTPSTAPNKNPFIRPLRPYHAVEYWRHGKQIPSEDALEVISRLPGLDLSALRLVR